MEGYKRINFNVPEETFNSFKEIFPYRGEITAFLCRCIEAAVISNKRKLSSDEIEFTIQRVREEI